MHGLFHLKKKRKDVSGIENKIQESNAIKVVTPVVLFVNMNPNYIYTHTHIHIQNFALVNPKQQGDMSNRKGSIVCFSCTGACHH